MTTSEQNNPEQGLRAIAVEIMRAFTDFDGYRYECRSALAAQIIGPADYLDGSESQSLCRPVSNNNCKSHSNVCNL